MLFTIQSYCFDCLVDGQDRIINESLALLIRLASPEMIIITEQPRHSLASALSFMTQRRNTFRLPIRLKVHGAVNMLHGYFTITKASH
ncbi:hypothetical protein HBI56_116230 [Parastagonospora nodorum]|nr:hypothetical protein HBH52_120120 [Parastagonospora nodorum]KAH4026585.1 hypothetical protein HBI13_064160 [Parastagonospora nodorum]KAH4068193.1 hypothetical protein HBH50_123800 [Parastagonospora nodorum]KAH4167075.1 hypothetical protein HBH43_132920 [Parastagonospora nodorum]KAH4191925.1 hypothetical protein HBH42_115750 [Parastagonospora nodorum]